MAKLEDETAEAVTAMVTSLMRQIQNVDIQELSKQMSARRAAGEVAINSFGTAGTAGTLSGCFGTAGTFGSLGVQELSEAPRR